MAPYENAYGVERPPARPRDRRRRELERRRTRAAGDPADREPPPRVARGAARRAVVRAPGRWHRGDELLRALARARASDGGRGRRCRTRRRARRASAAGHGPDHRAAGRRAGDARAVRARAARAVPRDPARGGLDRALCRSRTARGRPRARDFGGMAATLQLACARGSLAVPRSAAVAELLAAELEPPAPRRRRR